MRTRTLDPVGFSDGTVLETIRLNDRLRRVIVRVDSSAALAVPVGADAAVGVYFPDTAAASPESTMLGRTYTVRRHDGDRLTIDIALHSHGPGTCWAAVTRPGDRVRLDHARSWYRPEPSSEWQLVVCDLSGLPAAARIIESHCGATMIVIAEVPNASDLDYLPDGPGVTVIPSVGTGNGMAPSRLAELVAETAYPGGRGYCWFGGETGQARAVRKHFRALGWSLEQTDITGYWRQDSERWDAMFAPVADEMFAVYQRARAAGLTEKAAAETYDAALERAGL